MRHKWYMSSGITVILSYTWAATLIVWSVWSIATWHEMYKERMLDTGAYKIKTLFIDLVIPLAVIAIALWTILNGSQPDLMILMAATLVLAINWNFATQWNKIKS